MATKGIKIITKNKRAYHDYLVMDKFEAGLVLKGTEVKTLRQGKGNLNDSYVNVDDDLEAWIHNFHIPSYEFGNINNHEERRKRKLLLAKKEIEKIHHAQKAKGLTVIPLALYFKGSYVKIEIALAKGKKLYDKRQDEAKKDVEKKLRQGRYE
ncbi:MAG: SsrA-binding protein SmpB [Halobacteriovoraceae bacterium]|nr:SsrA-binding protein SmpB [Halobacteriovoraceae bacterium]MCB9095912.1 SsrA-binding protein SmpB [Halobacteriovoraceae bacterium]